MTKMIREEIIRALVEEKIAGSENFLVSVKVGHGNHIRVFIDADKGITIDTCVAISRHIESNLDRDKEDFELEVSSYGITAPLILERQYHKNVGRNVKVVLRNGEVIKGLLKEAQEQLFIIYEKNKIKKQKNTEEKVHRIMYSEVKETKLII